MLVDDVFDSGRSVIAVIKELKEKTRANLPKTIKIATPWYKPNRNATSIVPDFFIHETDSWLVFPHELSGLSIEEISAGKPEIAKTLPKLGRIIYKVNVQLVDFASPEAPRIFSDSMLDSGFAVISKHNISDSEISSFYQAWEHFSSRRT